MGASRLKRLPLIVSFTIEWTSRVKKTTSPAPPFAHGTKSNRLIGMLVFVIVVFPACAAVTLANAPSTTTASTANFLRMLPPLSPRGGCLPWAGRIVGDPWRSVHRTGQPAARPRPACVLQVSGLGLTAVGAEVVEEDRHVPVGVERDVCDFAGYKVVARPLAGDAETARYCFLVLEVVEAVLVRVVERISALILVARRQACATDTLKIDVLLKVEAVAVDRQLHD